jgi:hypothetical protein
MYERLAQDRQELDNLEAQRVWDLADEALEEKAIDAGLSRRVEALRARVKEDENTLAELCSRHHEAAHKETRVLSDTRHIARGYSPTNRFISV